MYLSHMMGIVNTQVGAAIDLRLLLLFLPLCFFVAFIATFRKVISLSDRGVNLSIKLANYGLVILVSLFLVEKVFQGLSGTEVIGFLTNVDILVGAIFAGLVFFKKTGLARAFMPSIVILAGASMLNNSSSSIDVLQMVTDMFAIGLSIFIAIFTNKLITTNAFVVASAFTTVLVVYSYFVNGGFVQFGFSSLDQIAKEKTRLLLLLEIAKMAAFIGAIVFFKVFLWMMARSFFVIRNGGSLKDLLFWKEKQVLLKNGIRFFEKLFGISLTTKFGLDFEVSDEEETTLPQDEVKYEIEFTIIPRAVQNIFNAKGTRAPAFSF